MIIKVLVFLSITAALIASSTFNQVSSPRKTIDSFKSNSKIPIKFIGTGSKLRDVIAIKDVITSPDKYIDKVITVEGKILDLCRKAGCWMSLVDLEGTKITVKGNHSNIIFPVKFLKGKGRVTGKFKKHTLSLEQTIKYEVHMAEDRGEKIDINTIKEPKVLYRIHATGAVLFLPKS